MTDMLIHETWFRSQKNAENLTYNMSFQNHDLYLGKLQIIIPLGQSNRSLVSRIPLTSFIKNKLSPYANGFDTA